MVTLVGRILLGLLFLLAGFQKFGNMDVFTQFVEASGLPGVLAWPAAIFEVVAGLAVITGFYTRYAAVLLALFCAFTGIYIHFVPDDPTQMTNFMKNMALTGGFLVLFAHGAGPLSLDARLRPGQT